MPTRQHHYVPKFYLRRFKSECRRINLHNVQRQLTVRDASIKSQCAKPDYYRTAQIEGALSELETRSSIALSALCGNVQDCEMDTVRQFMVVQLLRTPSQAERTTTMHRKLQDFVGGDAIDAESRRRIRFDAIRPEDLPVYNLRMSDDLAGALRDLKSIVVEVEEDAFITSDNPVFKYNQYLEQVRDYGTDGLGQTGIQIFLPLSPKHMLVMYDKDVYDYVKKQPPSETDIEVLNSLQVVSADRNLYFSDARQSATVKNLASEYAHLRQGDPVTVEQFSSDENPQDSLLLGYYQTPNVGMSLSFLRVKRRASRVSISKRLRNVLRPPFRHPASRQDSPNERFSTRVAKH